MINHHEVTQSTNEINPVSEVRLTEDLDQMILNLVRKSGIIDVLRRDFVLYSWVSKPDGTSVELGFHDCCRRTLVQQAITEVVNDYFKSFPLTEESALNIAVSRRNGKVRVIFKFENGNEFSFRDGSCLTHILNSARRGVNSCVN